MSKSALVVGTPMYTREYGTALSHLGVQVTTSGGLREAEGILQSGRHFGAIAVILPNYYDEITSFVKNARGVSNSRSTPIIYIGGPIEGGNQTALRSLGVKTLTLGPVQTDEMARFIERQIA
jgi:hypothetical protein